jgi:hypothetical protein
MRINDIVIENNQMLRPNGQVVINDSYVLDPGNRF